ncbi:hypothetical protein PoB_000092700 [Plakobranchus ocellatus]|uniref:Uncharacterized protein n=1 Tax=Plakobranchus ocellatus TaxID=259542 RepID=A0AAV3XX45_9GAST|nr:hypothetical protein PoB_000092700 [Plakobranchus ocellatus]
MATDDVHVGIRSHKNTTEKVVPATIDVVCIKVGKHATDIGLIAVMEVTLYPATRRGMVTDVNAAGVKQVTDTTAAGVPVLYREDRGHGNIHTKRNRRHCGHVLEFTKVD